MANIGSIQKKVVWMSEKRDGQDLIRLYLPKQLKERFKLYCQLKGVTMTEVVKDQIEQLLDSKDFAELLEARLKTKKPEDAA